MRRILFFAFVLVLTSCSVYGQIPPRPPTIEVFQVSIVDQTETPIEVPDGAVELTAAHFGDLVNPTHLVHLTCTAAQPIEWTFDGPEYNSVHDFVEDYERLGNWPVEGDEVDTFRSRLLISSPERRSTGSYKCQWTAQTTVASSLYLFMNPAEDPIFFQPSVHHLLTDDTYNTNQTLFYLTPEEQEGDHITLPFMSNRRTFDNLQLYKGDVALTQLDDWMYDSRDGLWLNLASPNLANVFDDLFSLFQQVHIEDPFLFNFHFRKSFIVEPNEPTTSYGQTNRKMFTCKATQPIEFVMEDNQTEEPLPEAVCSEEGGQHTCEIELVPAMYSYRSKLNCQYAVVDGVVIPPGSPVLHTWLFTRETPTQASLTYDQITKRIQCCTWDHYQPRLEVVNTCNSFSECNLRRVQLANQDLTGDVVEKFDPSKVCSEKWIFFGESITHGNLLAGCSVGPEAFTFAQYSKYNKSISVLNRANIQADSLLAMVPDQLNEFYEPSTPIESQVGDVVSMACASDRLFYGTPIVTVETADGSTEVSELNCQYPEDSYAANWHFCTGAVMLNATDVIGISCRARNLNSVDAWGVKSMKTTVSPDRSSGSYMCGSLITTFLTLYIRQLWQ